MTGNYVQQPTTACEAVADFLAERDGYVTITVGTRSARMYEAQKVVELVTNFTERAS